MGNYKFKLSDMIPNAWFYKLKDMGNIGKSRSRSRSRSKTQSQSQGININSPRRSHHHHSRRASPLISTPKPLFSPPPQKSLLPKRASFYISSPTTRPHTQKKLLLTTSPSSSSSSSTSPPTPPRRSKKKSRVRPVRPTKPTKAAAASPASSACTCRVWEPDTLSDLSSPSPKSPFHLRNVNVYVDVDADEEEEAHERPIKAHQEYDHGPRNYCTVTSSAADIIIDVSNSSRSVSSTSTKLGADFNDLELPPIITKPADTCRPEDEPSGDADAAQRRRRSHSNGRPRRSNYAGLQRLRARANSPRLSGAKIKARVSTPPTPTKRALNKERVSGTNTARNNCYREGIAAQKSLGGSFVVVKSSMNPQKDFKESMVEMIVENKLRNSKDLEDLLACYLSLNSDEYHDLIVKAFEQIWFDLNFR